MTSKTASLQDLLVKLEDSLESANQALPSHYSEKFNEQSGISLLDIKSELFLSYLQNLAFLMLVKLRYGPKHPSGFDEAGNSAHGVRRGVLKKLVELRIFLERGVRPLEARLKYQIDKVVRASNSAERYTGNRVAKHSSPPRKEDIVTAAPSVKNSDARTAGEHADSDSSSDGPIDDLSYRPNTAAFDDSLLTPAAVKARDTFRNTGIFRPPRKTPASLPTTKNFNGRARGAHKVLRSSTIDDYISNEVSTAPLAEPSIGSTIIARGRTTRTALEAKEESQRTAYEEANFVRLPPMSKKEKAKRRGKTENGFGGEELRILGAGLDRIGQATKKRREGGATEDGQRGQGFDESRRAGKKRRLGTR